MAFESRPKDEFAPYRYVSCIKYIIPTRLYRIVPVRTESRARKAEAMPGSGSILESALRSFKLWVARGRQRARSLIGQYPALYPPFARWKRRQRLRHARKWGIESERRGPVQRDTDVVIAGFPRSANTFAATAFGLAQPNSIRVDSHLHAPSQVIWAAKLGIPTMVLIRDPEEAVLSFVLKQPYITLKQGLKEYVRFYRRILPYRDGFVVARFEEVSTDFGASIARLNARFGTSFQEFDHTDDNVARCFEIIEQWLRKRNREGQVVDERVPRPSRQRETMKNELRAAFRSPGLAKVRADAYSLYETLTA